MKNEKTKILIFYHVICVLLAAGFGVSYSYIVMLPGDFTSVTGINAVAGLHASKPFQFRLLVPFLFSLTGQTDFITQRAEYAVFSSVVTYLILQVFRKLTGLYLNDSSKTRYLSILILYPMIWNYVVLNGVFSFYDIPAIFFYTLGLYFIVKENYKLLLVCFIFGLLNKESAVYLIFAYIFFNYRLLFSKKIMLNTAILVIAFVLIKAVLSYVFRDNEGSSMEAAFLVNVEIFRDLFRNRVYMKHVFMNFGAMYIPVILLFITGRWRKINDRKMLAAQLIFIPYLTFGFFILYFTENRVYTELILAVTILCLLYLSTFEKLRLELSNESAKG